ncbi:MAG: hypothetical protein J07HR59_01773, partial [Halorubrum sp. J07HR59]
MASRVSLSSGSSPAAVPTNGVAAPTAANRLSVARFSSSTRTRHYLI